MLSVVRFRCENHNYKGNCKYICASQVLVWENVRNMVNTDEFYCFMEESCGMIMNKYCVEKKAGDCKNYDYRGKQRKLGRFIKEEIKGLQVEK